MINLRTKALENYVMFCLGKTDNDYTTKELKNIKSLSLNPIDINSNYKKVYLEDLEYFPNIKYLTISNMYLDIASFAYVLRLQNLISIVFVNCSFQDLSILSNFKLIHIGFINSEIENIGMINRIKSLKEITLIGYKDIDLSYFLNLNLTFIELTNSTIKDNSILKDFDSLITLNINNTNIMNLNFVTNLKKLKNLCISNTQYQANKNIIDKIKDKVVVRIDNDVIVGKGVI